MSQTHVKTALHHSKLLSSVMGLLVAANVFILVGFIKVREDGVHNYIRRAFAVAPAIYASTNDTNIINDVQEYISKHQKENISAKPKNGFKNETIFQLAQTYRDKGDQATNLNRKALNYSFALLELEKLPQKDPRIVKKVKPAKQELKVLLQSISTLGIGAGDKQEKIELHYGLADKVEQSDRYYPVGSVTFLTYDTAGLQFGLRNNRIFAINIRSNFKGIIDGVQIGDNVNSIKALYKGRTNDFPGNNFAYLSNRTKNQRLTFVFSDKDNLVDGIKIFDKKMYGSWESVLQ